MVTKSEVVKIGDEHNQPIEILNRHGFWYWLFDRLPLGEQDINGPFDTRAEAITSAKEFCLNHGR